MMRRSNRGRFSGGVLLYGWFSGSLDYCAGFPTGNRSYLCSAPAPAAVLADLSTRRNGHLLYRVFTLKSSKLEEKQGRILKLIGGMLMLTLAGVMLVNPTLMNNLSSSMLIFGAALGATLLILLFHRVILPKLGIRIGSEIGSTNPGKAGSRH
jgi:hypothetical protein